MSADQSGNDRLFGGDGNDTLISTSGNDLLFGGDSHDVLYGGDGNSTLYGDNGNDLLFGGDGNETLIGGAGADTLTGGDGFNIFDYNSVSESRPGVVNRDVITDFAGAGDAIGDKIDIRTIDANVLVTGNQTFTYIGNAAFTAAGQLRYNTTSGILSGSTDADAASEFQIQLVGTPALLIGGAGTDVIL